MNGKRQVQTKAAPVGKPALSPARPGLLQRTCACGGAHGLDGECRACRKRRLTLQRRATHRTEPSAAPPIVHAVLQSPGRPLDPAARAFMEPRFGHDFGRVRIHTDTRAAASARAVNASAYTVGRDVVFADAKYAPRTAAGRRLLAHELAHTIQQAAAEPSAQAGLEVASPDETAEREADRVARDVVAGSASSIAAAGARRLARATPDAGAPSTGVPAGPPAPTTTDCTPPQTAMLNDHLSYARTWVNDAEARINAASAGTAPPAVDSVVRAALSDHFHATSAADIATIARNFTQLKTGLGSTFTYECETECERGEHAYVKGGGAWLRRGRNIHICPKWFALADFFARVTTLIHERAHQYPGADGDTYEEEAAYLTLSVDEAIDNAASYAGAARQIYHGGAHGRNTTMDATYLWFKE